MSSRKMSTLNGVIFIGLACVLVACADEGHPPAASSEAQSTSQQATSQQATSQQATSQQATSPAAAQQSQSIGRISLENCQTPDNGKVLFRVSRTTLSIPSTEIQETVPRGLSNTFTAEQAMAELQRQASTGAGCPGKPLDLLALGIQVPDQNTLLRGTIGLIATNSAAQAAEYAKFTTRLQTQTPKTCSQVDGGLLLCPATQKIGNRDVEIAYVVSTDRTKKMRSGGPLAAQCGRQGQSIGNCKLIDLDSQGTAFEASLKNAQFTTASLDQAWRAAQAAIDQRRQ
ncbi:MAG: hypothetical protein AAF293_11625 [Pseudomonadota bacterium]